MTKLIDVTALSNTEKLSAIFDMPIKSNDLVGAAREFVQANGVYNGMEPSGKPVSSKDPMSPLLSSYVYKVFEALSKAQSGTTNDPINALYAANFKLGSILVDPLDGDLTLNASIQGSYHKGPKPLSIKVPFENPVLNSYAYVEYPVKQGLWFNQIKSVNAHLFEGNRSGGWFPPKEAKTELPFARVPDFVMVVAGVNDQVINEKPSVSMNREDATNAKPLVERSPHAITFYTEDTKSPTTATIAKWIREGLSEDYSNITIQRGETAVDLKVKRVFADRPYEIEIDGFGFGSALKNIQKAVEDFNAVFAKGKDTLTAAKKDLDR